MTVPALRNSASVSRTPTQDASALRPSARMAGVEGGQQASRTPSLSNAMQTDGFDVGGGKRGAALGHLLQDTLQLMTSLTQLVAQTVSALDGAQGARGVEGGQGKGCGKSRSTDTSDFTPSKTNRPPVELNPTENQGGTTQSQGTTQTKGSEGGSKLGGNLPPALEKFRGAIESAAAKTGMPAEMLAAQIWQESRGNLEAVSTNGGNGLTDTGLMQVNPNTYGELQAKHPELAGKNLSDPATNILAGAFYMKDMKEQFGSVDLALRAYNSGPNGVDKSNPNAIPAGTGDATYVTKVKGFMETLSSGQGTLPA